MRRTLSCLPVAMAISFWGCSPKEAVDPELASTYPQTVAVTAVNTTDLQQSDAIVLIDVSDLRAKSPDFNSDAYIVLHGNTELPAQTIDGDGDEAPEQIAILSNFAAHETKRLDLRFARSGRKVRAYDQRAQAELSSKFGGEWRGDIYVGGEFRNVESSSVRNWHTDHTGYYRYEGPGWESDKVGFRFYLDWRNAIDIFGKRTAKPVLQNIGLDGYDSYHEMAEWGMDLLKVGESLGIGSLGIWLDGKAVRVNKADSVRCEIVANGPIVAGIRTRYSGWQVGGHNLNLISDLSISAGSRMTSHVIAIDGNPPNLCTGLVKEKNVAYFVSEPADDGEWRYIANYGKQSLAGDLLGMAVLFRNSDLIELTEDSLSRVVVLNPSGGRLEYHFVAAWEQEQGGIKSEQAFLQYLDDVVMALNSPVRLEI